MAYSSYITALFQHAAISPAVRIDPQAPDVVHLQPNPEPVAAKVENSDLASFRKHCESIRDTGLETVRPNSPDHIAVMMKFVDRIMSTGPEGKVTGDRAYTAYLSWSAHLHVPPMPRATFKSHLHNLITVFSGNIAVGTSATGDHSYCGLGL